MTIRCLPISPGMAKRKLDGSMTFGVAKRDTDIREGDRIRYICPGSEIEKKIYQVTCVPDEQFLARGFIAFADKEIKRGKKDGNDL